MILLEKIRWMNFLSTGNIFNEINLADDKMTLIAGINGSGKCLDPATKVEISFKDKNTEKKFKKFLKKRQKLS